MAIKRRTVQELRNGFPDWTKARNDDQSVANGLLNTIAGPIDFLDTELYRNKHNWFLSTFNVSELDTTYRFSLPSNFEFEVDDPTQLTPIEILPTVYGYNNLFVSGLVSGVQTILPVPAEDILDFWYQATPTRFVVLEEYLAPEVLDVQFLSSSGINEYSELFLENYLTIKVEGNNLFDEDSNPDGFLRSKVKIDGITWKGTSETEEVYFTYPQTKITNKIWREINSIQPLDFPEEGTISITSHNFGIEYKPDSYRELSQFKHSRDNFPSFWSIEDLKLQLSTYTADSAINVLRGFIEHEIVREWDLLSSGTNLITPSGLALVPYSDFVWVSDESSIYLYDTHQELPNLIEHGTPGANTIIEVSTEYPVSNEEVEVNVIYRRPVKTVLAHRLTITYPDGTQFGIDEESDLVSINSNYWIKSQIEKRVLRAPVLLQLEDYGDHLLTLETQYVDFSTETDYRTIRVSGKLPLKTFDLTEYLDSEPILGLCMDHEHKLLVKTQSKILELKFYYDYMLVNFDTKELIFREKYDRVKVYR